MEVIQELEGKNKEKCDPEARCWEQYYEAGDEVVRVEEGVAGRHGPGKIMFLFIFLQECRGAMIWTWQGRCVSYLSGSEDGKWIDPDSKTFKQDGLTTRTNSLPSLQRGYFKHDN